MFLFGLTRNFYDLLWLLSIGAIYLLYRFFSKAKGKTITNKLILISTILLFLLILGVNCLDNFSEKKYLVISASISLISGILFLYIAINDKTPKEEDLYSLNTLNYIYSGFGFICFIICLYSLLFH